MSIIRYFRRRRMAAHLNQVLLWQRVEGRA
jgi:hypothetical protein